eukprot:gb/GECG01011317.1/.p1 GENE.gb/GECG01011317.1/~~gb/GECG01011317.1/.p1  ORF type:complete len:116 (+),score=5.45 gb/GECG01011317.1/:1-348(+)
MKGDGVSFAIPRCYRSINSPDPACPHTIYNGTYSNEKFASRAYDMHYTVTMLLQPGMVECRYVSLRLSNGNNIQYFSLHITFPSLSFSACRYLHVPRTESRQPGRASQLNVEKLG